MKTGIAGPILWNTAIAMFPGVVWVLQSHIEASVSDHLRIMATPPHSITLAPNYGDRFLASCHQDMGPKLGSVVGSTITRDSQIHMLKERQDRRTNFPTDSDNRWTLTNLTYSAYLVKLTSPFTSSTLISYTLPY